MWPSRSRHKGPRFSGLSNRPDPRARAGLPALAPLDENHAVPMRDEAGTCVGAVEFRSNRVITGWVDQRYQGTLRLVRPSQTIPADIMYVPRPDLPNRMEGPVRGFFCDLKTDLAENDEVALLLGDRPVASFAHRTPRAGETGAEGVIVHLDEPGGDVTRRHVRFSGWMKAPLSTGSIAFTVDGQAKSARFHPRWDAVLQLGSPRVIGFEFDHEMAALGRPLVFGCAVDGRDVHRSTIETRSVARCRTDQPLTLFMHIPKTAGTSVANAFRKQTAMETCWLYGPRTVEEQVSAIKDQVGEFDLVGGHFPYGLHRSFGRECRYITFFREPHDLLFSFFNYVKYVVRHPAWADVEFRDAVQRRLDFHLDNPLTRYLSDAPPGQRLTWDDVKRAADNMKRRFAVVGIVNRMEESLQRLSEKLDISLDVGVDNRTVGGKLRDEDGGELKRFLQPFTAFDDSLYLQAQEAL